MAHSPYSATIYPPIRDLEEARRDVRHYRSQLDDGENDKYAMDYLVPRSEELIEFIDFLAAKLDIKKQEYAMLVKQNQALTKKEEALKMEVEVQKTQVAGLKVELERAAATASTATATATNNDERGIEANPGKKRKLTRDCGNDESTQEAHTVAVTDETAAKGRSGR